jgi:hypothetical protein
MKIVKIAVLLVWLLFEMTQPGWATAGEFKHSLGYGSYVIPGRWTPLRVWMRGGPDPARVEIQRLAGSESYSGRNEEWIECPVFADESSASLRLRLIAAGRVLAGERLNLFTKMFPGHLILTVAIPAAVQRTIQTALDPDEPVLTVAIDYQDLPVNGLSYDSVSGLVIADPGPVLAPAQLGALRGWLVGGGRLVIFGTPGPDSLLSAFTGFRAGKTGGDGSFMVPMGLGGIVMIQPELSGSKAYQTAGRWRELLALRPYLETSRLTAADLFEAAEPASKPVRPKRGVTLGVALSLAAWYGMILISSLSRRNRWRKLAAGTVLAMILIFPVASHWSGIWRRGAAICGKGVLLPGSGRGLIKVGIGLSPSSAWELGPDPASPWGIRVALDSDQGLFRPNRDRSEWNHLSSAPGLHIRQLSSHRLELTGSIPIQPQSMIIPNPEPGLRSLKIPQLLEHDLLWWNGRTFASYSDQGWSRLTANPPGWLKGEERWLRQLRRRFPELHWIIGRGDLLGSRLRIEHYPVRDLIWLMPVI